MAKNTADLLGKHPKQFLEGRARTRCQGFEGDASRAAPGSSEEREERLTFLRGALILGEDSGGAGPLDVANTKRRARAAIARQRGRT